MATTLVIRKRDLHYMKFSDYEMNKALDGLERFLKFCRSRYHVRIYIRKGAGMIKIVGEDQCEVQGAAENIVQLMNHSVCLERRRRLIGSLNLEL